MKLKAVEYRLSFNGFLLMWLLNFAAKQKEAFALQVWKTETKAWHLPQMSSIVVLSFHFHWIFAGNNTVWHHEG